MNFLLDVNALIAGVYEDHEHHAVMRTWMSQNKDQGLRVAPLVLTGCLRILMTVSGEKKMQKIVTAFAAFKNCYNVEMVQDDIELEQLGKWVSGPKQVTDAHLLAIAKRHELSLLTFDMNIPGKAVLCLG